ncbi:MAG: hypothetical protein JO030_07930 [Candidatus Eremiobacteraeota bacterium]|nr:hypothetical protein [Candidatus Eremiobacteraeota bacterium]
MTYASPVRGRVPAILVTPTVAGAHPAVVYLHWGFGNESEFKDEALALAHHNVISLLVSAPWARPDPWKHAGEGHFTQPSADIDLYRQTVADVREGIDLLVARSDVDAGAIGFVGHSYGATWGGVVLGTDARVRAGVLIAGLPTISDFSAPFAAGAYMLEDYNRQVFGAFSTAKIAAYAAALAPYAPQRWVRNSRAAILFQFAGQDQFISAYAAREYAAAVPEAEVKNYPCAEHRLSVPQAQADRIAFLAQHLHF